jgi:hypothetical protein
MAILYTLGHKMSNIIILGNFKVNYKDLFQAAGFMSSIEAYSSSGWQPINAPLPEGVHFSCSVTLNATAVLLIGGQSDSQVNFIHFININSYFDFQLTNIKKMF